MLIGRSVAELDRKSIFWKTSGSNGQMPVIIYYTVSPIWTSKERSDLNMDSFELLEQILLNSFLLIF